VTDFHLALDLYHSPPTPQHQLAAIVGLTSTRDPALVQQTVGMLMSGEVAEQNVATFLMVSLPLISLVPVSETC
jgi:aminopeptidase 2